MRWIAVLLVLLSVGLLQAPAYAGDHWGPGGGPTGPTPGVGVLIVGIVLVIITIIILAWLIISFLGASAPCAFFVAVGSVATRIVVGEYFLLIIFNTWVPQTLAQQTVIALLNIIVLVVMLILAAPCCLKKPVSLPDALKITIASALLPVVFHLVVKR